MDERVAMIRLVVVGAAAPVVAVVGGFCWFVAVSWGVLEAAIGVGALVLLVAVVGSTVAAWSWLVVRKFRHPLRRLPRRLRLGVAAVTVAALACGWLAMPWTRTELERDKCRAVAAVDEADPYGCLDWLRSRREWWTLGLSHRDGSNG